MITIAHDHNVARIVDGVKDNPNELTVGRNGNRVIIGLEDRDGGDKEMWIEIDEADLTAALAVTKSGSVSQ